MFKYKGIYFTDDFAGENKEKPTIVFLHGFFMDSRMFRYQVEYFKSDYRVICCDFRGFGKTEWNKESFTLEDLVDDILNVLKSLDVSTCIVAGMSMGGYVAQRMALSCPETINSLVLIATQASRDNPDTIESYHQLRDNWDNIEAREQIIEALLPVIIGRNKEESEYWKNIWLSYQIENIYHPMTAMTSRSEIDVSQIQVPCLVVHGADDTGIPLHAGEQLHHRLSNSTMVAVEGACHAVNLTHPDVVNEAIEKFLVSSRT